MAKPEGQMCWAPAFVPLPCPVMNVVQQVLGLCSPRHQDIIGAFGPRRFPQRIPYYILSADKMRFNVAKENRRRSSSPTQFSGKSSAVIAASHVNNPVVAMDCDSLSVDYLTTEFVVPIRRSSIYPLNSSSMGSKEIHTGRGNGELIIRGVNAVLPVSNYKLLLGPAKSCPRCRRHVNELHLFKQFL